MKKNLTLTKEDIHSKKNTILPFIIVFCLPVLLYLQTLGFGFTNADDDDIIINNLAFLSDFRNAPQAFLKDAFLEKVTPLYRPLQTLSYMVDIILSGGNNAWMYHLSNVLLLGLIAFLLFLLLRKFLIPFKLALLSTLIYCAHPLFISTVAWIPARGDLLLLFFSLLSFLFFIKYLQKRKVIYLFINWLTFTIALFCKETAAILPFLFAIYYFTFSFEKHSDSYRNEKKLLLNIVLYAISGICWFWLRSMAIGTYPNRNNVGLIPFISNLRTIPESLANFFLPFDIEVIPRFSLFKTLTGLVIIVIIIALFFKNKERSKKKKLFCLSWFLFLLLPTMFYKTEYIDYLPHRFFLPLTGILLFVLFSFPRKWFEKKNIKNAWIPVVIFVFLSSATFVKARSYADPMTYCNSIISQNPHNALMYNNRGYLRVNSGNFRDAINDYTKAIELNPGFAQIYYNRGNAFEAVGYFTEAIKDYDKAIELNPVNADAYYNRGNAYRVKGDLAQAIKDYDNTIELNPNYVYAYNNRGLIYYNEGNPEFAIKDFDKVLELDPDYIYAYNNRGLAYAAAGNLEMAIRDYSKAIKLYPNYTDAYYNRGMAYKAKGMMKEAGRDFEMYDKLTVKK